MTAFGAFGNRAQNGADLDGVARFHGDGLQRAVGGRRHFDGHFVGFEFQQRLVAMDRVAFLLEPARDSGFGDGLAHRRYFDLDAH